MRYYFALQRAGKSIFSNQPSVSSLRLCPNSRVQIDFCNDSSFQSAINLQSLYPSSSLRITSPNKVPDSPDGKFNGYIPLDSLKITYSHSSGPGGQHVNKVNTKVDMRLHVESADWLKPSTRAKIAEIHKTKISKEGFLIVRSDKTRSQQLNLADCMENLRALIRMAEFTPATPSRETEEQIRRRKEKANQIRLIEKKTRSMLKESRQAPLL